MSARSEQPTFTELLDWLEGRLDDRQSADVADRVAHADESTAETVAWLRSFLDSARRMPLQAPPAEASAALRTAVRERLTPWDPGEYVDAALVYDSRTAEAAGGTRAGLTPEDKHDRDVYHLIFDTEIGRVVLDVMRNVDGGVDVQGSLSQNAPNGDVLPRVVFTSNFTVRRTATCDQRGQFKVSGLPSGTDEMWIMDDRTRVRAAVLLDAGG
jgi:hypothetical protein